MRTREVHVKSVCLYELIEQLGDAGHFLCLVDEDVGDAIWCRMLSDVCGKVLGLPELGVLGQFKIETDEMGGSHALLAQTLLEEAQDTRLARTPHTGKHLGKAGASEA